MSIITYDYKAVGTCASSTRSVEALVDMVFQGKPRKVRDALSLQHVLHENRADFTACRKALEGLCAERRHGGGRSPRERVVDDGSRARVRARLGPTFLKLKTKRAATA